MPTERVAAGAHARTRATRAASRSRRSSPGSSRKGSPIRESAGCTSRSTTRSGRTRRPRWRRASSSSSGRLAPERGGRGRERDRQRGDGARRGQAGAPVGRELPRGGPGEVAAVTRIRWGGSLLEEARLHGAVKLLTVQPHAVAAGTVLRASRRVEALHPESLEPDLAVRVQEHVAAAAGGVSLAEAKVGRLRWPGCRLVGGLRDRRGARRPARRRGRLLARRHERRLAAAHRSGRSDGHEDLAGSLHRVRDQRRHAAHRRLPRREADPRHQRRSGGTDLRERRLRRDRRPA